MSLIFVKSSFLLLIIVSGDFSPFISPTLTLSRPKVAESVEVL